ncbi:hypothetical protein PACTADRAFT_50531 [Pachysolen tannophilus NRRL Y-2460]|uniref:DNA replication licensing factor MCM5 n=1 Tax=Pachysolen tannophilus NRRL Y-2460 TaxID=669874 RepID=A0A1E4TSM0_PACTA|nr:hypothetical protein PACTADRAFT_50531 [Pachysolen tannophilus NRRL Y-2460]
MSFDRPDIYGTSVLQAEDVSEDQFSEVIKAFKSFILEFRINNAFIYRDQLRENLLIKKYELTVLNEHLIVYNEELNKKLVDDPLEILPLFEQAITEISKKILYLSNEKIPLNFPNCQLILISKDNEVAIRELSSEHISKIVRISGIIISCSTLYSKATNVSIMCRSCKHTMKLKVSNNFGPIQLPKNCQSVNNISSNNGEKSECGPDPYLILHDKSTFVDEQSLKLQENPEDVPVGELPRHITLSVNRNLTNRLVPGNKCTLTGIYAIYQAKQKGSGANTSGNAVAIRNPYLKVLGIQSNSSDENHMIFSEQEEEEFIQMSRDPKIYEKFANSIAPSIFGSEDIKKALVCLLMSGSKKFLPDGMRLRGDINVLLLGDPGTAKSQLLKFIEKVSPISIYTSGKGSSAAGLTASVQRDATTREFYLEGGAMVLADGGIVCIDEFDKMRDEDRVAIHEAMEQQTISIAKAGITTILNSRTSVLAAANPIFGRYDDIKSAGENIDFQSTILSRFDLIFIIRDHHDEKNDRTIANHVLQLHATGGSDRTEVGDIPLSKMKRYVNYCKLKCAPRLSKEAAEMLSSHFVEIRKRVNNLESISSSRSSIPITIRQLESLVRISEALAKIQLSPIATEEHVKEALRLFNASTLDAIQSDSSSNNEDIKKEIETIEIQVKRRLPIGWSTSYKTLKREFVDGKGFNQQSLDRALYILSRHDTIQMRNQNANIYRSGV